MLGEQKQSVQLCRLDQALECSRTFTARVRASGCPVMRADGDGTHGTLAAELSMQARVVTPCKPERTRSLVPDQRHQAEPFSHSLGGKLT